MTIRTLVAMFAVVLALSARGEVLSRIAFGSCANQDLPQPIWDGILAAEPELFVFLGDNIYGGGKSMAVMREKYEKLAAVAGYQRLRASVPVEAIWDDHDYGENDGGASFAGRSESQQVFLDFFEEPAGSERRATEGIYAVREYGPPDKRVQLILLDTRYFKSPWAKSLVPGKRYKPVRDARRTILGEAQWQWLDAQLDRPATVRFIASGIQVINNEHGYEHWGHFPHERRRLLDLIREKGVGGVVLLSGDRHFSEIAAVDVGYPLLELTASGMTHSWPDGPASKHSNRLVAYGELNFGLIEIDWSDPDPLIRIGIHDVAGRRVTGVWYRLSQLQPR